MSLSSRPAQPVPPESMELVFFYRCPGCGRRNPLIAPTQPSMTRCESCGEPFPVMPVDERTVHYVKIMLATGRAALDPDFASFWGIIGGGERKPFSRKGSSPLPGPPPLTFPRFSTGGEAAQRLSPFYLNNY